MTYIEDNQTTLLICQGKITKNTDIQKNPLFWL